MATVGPIHTGAAYGLPPGWGSQYDPQQGRFVQIKLPSSSPAPAAAPSSPAPAQTGPGPGGYAQGGGQLTQQNAPIGMPTGPSLVNPQTAYQLPSIPNVALGQQPSTQWDAYQKLLANPGDVASNPAYQFLQQQGSQALSRQLGQTGQRFSGNALTAAEQYGQGIAGQYFGQLANTLGNASQMELQRYLQPAQAQAGLNVQAAQVGQGNYGLAQGDVRNLITANLYNNMVNQNTSAQQGYQSLLPQIQNIASALQSNQAIQGGGNGSEGGWVSDPSMPGGGFMTYTHTNPTSTGFDPTNPYGNAYSSTQSLGPVGSFGGNTPTYSGQAAMNYINQGY